MNKARLARLEKALRQRQTYVAQRGGGLPLEYRTLPDGTQIGVYEMTDEEAVGVLDILFGVAGAGVLANTISYGLTSEEEAQRERDLIETGFTQGEGGQWEIGQEAESVFLQSWLAEADKSGRQVKDRQLIERWIVHGGGNLAPAQVDAPTHTVAPPPVQEGDLGVSSDQVQAQRARDRDGISDDEVRAWKDASRSNAPAQPDEMQDALTRRQARRSGRRYH